MNLTLQRSDYLADGILGVLTKDDNDQIAVTLEHAYEIGIMTEGYKPKVAAGVYKCVRHAPNRLPYETFEVMNVPDFQGQPVTGILIHIGNFNTNSDGCILVGRRFSKGPGAVNMVTESALTFDSVMLILKGVDSFQLTVKDKA